MWCATCDVDLKDCKCANRDERIEKGIVENPHMVHKRCVECKKHYLICKCANPTWESSDPNYPLPKEYV